MRWKMATAVASCIIAATGIGGIGSTPASAAPTGIACTGDFVSAGNAGNIFFPSRFLFNISGSGGTHADWRYYSANVPFYMTGSVSDGQISVWVPPTPSVGMWIKCNKGSFIN